MRLALGVGGSAALGEEPEAFELEDDFVDCAVTTAPLFTATPTTPGKIDGDPVGGGGGGGGGPAPADFALDACTGGGVRD
mmetsp:Transcript_47858/g.154284  ORF Transcript_47858/g.154284 Transcript_47858/m.154284 type:complete len:80 (+) Transcript_47858:2735-2974(+)